MKLHILGSGTLVPLAGRASAGLAIEEAGEFHHFDLGRGILQRAADQGIDPLAMASLQISHLHPDHCCDLVPLWFGLNYHPEGARTKSLPVLAPVGFEEFLERLASAWRWLQPRFPLEVERPGTVDRGGLKVESVAMNHGEIAALGFRVHGDGWSVAYTGDTGPGPGLLSLARGVDILVAECSLPDARAIDTHLSPTPLGQAAAESGCQTLVVTHRYPELTEAAAEAGIRRHYGGELIFATDGLVIER